MKILLGKQVPDTGQASCHQSNQNCEQWTLHLIHVSGSVKQSMSSNSINEFITSPLAGTRDHFTLDFQSSFSYSKKIELHLF